MTTSDVRPSPGGDDVAQVLQALDELADHRLPGSDLHGDSRSGEVYILNDEIVTALKVAVVTGRPLLLGGPPGCGKSSLAAYVARNLGVAYHEFTTTDEAKSADLTWRLDTLRRLGDAQAKRLPRGAGIESVAPYVEPGPLWWALDRESAARRAFTLPSQGDGDVADPMPEPPEAWAPAGAPETLEDHEATRPGAVLLIDEIDKADSAFCNGLLVPLGSKRVAIPVLNLTIHPPRGHPSWSPLTLITTNNERDLPEAFLRRCVVLRLKAPTAAHLRAIVDRYFPDLAAPVRQVVDRLADQVAPAEQDGTVVAATRAGDPARTASTAEFIDLVRAVDRLSNGSGDLDEETLGILTRVTLNKHALYERRERRWLR